MGDDKKKKKKKKDKKGGFGFSMKMPKFHGPNFGGGAKGDVNLDGPDANLDIDGKAKLDADIPDADVKLKSPDMDVGAGADVKLPDVDVKSPDADINLPKGDASAGLDFGLKGRKGS